MSSSVLSQGERESALAFAEALIPGGGRVRRADERSLLELEELLRHAFAGMPRVWGKATQMIDEAARVRFAKPFRALSHADQQSVLRTLEDNPATAGFLHLMSFPLKFAHFDRREVYEGLGGRLNVVSNMEEPRWLSQVLDATTYDDDDDIECDVVVVGTGAGGAVVGRELAERGHAVVFVEEGKHVRRDGFTGSSRQAHLDLYRGGLAVGNSPFPIFMGRLVGGSTAVNGGTSFRTPDWVLDRWCEDMNTSDFTPTEMERYFTKVEGNLGIEPADRRFVGRIQEVFRKGCEAHGWSHFVINRNAPGCEGSGFCDFGCRTDARRSTNLSYVPPALERGAMLFTRLRCDRILTDAGRAVGIEGVAVGSDKRIRVRGKAVVFAGGALPTPFFLLRHGLCNSSGQLGQNLTLHPSGGLTALFDEPLYGPKQIPQGYGSDEFLRDGLLLTAAQPDWNIASLVVPSVGDRLVDLLNTWDFAGCFGILIADEARGRVLVDRDGGLATLYSLTPKDTERLHRGIGYMGDIAWAAGARKLFPAVLGQHIVESRAEWEAWKAKPPSPAQIMLTSYHPLGTAKMGRDPRHSVVDLDHEAHDLPGLFIVDGSTVSGPLGVNPQLTIMAMATRAAERIHAKL